MVRTKPPRHVIPKTRNIEEMIRRTPPHLLSKHNKKHLNINESTSLSHPIGNISTNPIKIRSTWNYDQSGYRGSSLPLLDHSMHTGIVPQEGETKQYLYLPMLLSIISKASTSSYEEGAPSCSDREHQRSSRGGSKSGGSNSRTTDYHPPYQLSSFYPVVPCTNGNHNWNHSDQHQELRHLHCNKPGREEQLPLPSYVNSNDTNINNTTRTRQTSSILGKRPAASSPSQSFQQPPTRQPLDAPETVSEYTDELFGLVQSVGTPEFLSSLDKVFRSGSYDHTSSIHATAGSSGTASEPSLTLGLGNDSTFDEGKGKEVHSYSAFSVTAETRESIKKQRKETDQSSSKLTLALDGHGCSKNTE